MRSDTLLRRRITLASRAGTLLALLVVLLPGLLGCAQSQAEVKFPLVELHPLVAQSSGARSQGLQGHDRGDAARGMLFVWPDEGVRTFSIKDVPYALDLVFMDGDGLVVAVDGLVPDSTVQAAGTARYVLEVEAGWVRANGVEVGDRAQVLLGR
ncbi:MAG: DUF192 domain-containing protein [Actinomycetota bacterium]|nr:DUF192 domain-containing protein [Actinomycetota bacterium]